jgi:hypothetical protein
MGLEQAYFLIGFLLGCILMGCICVVACILWYESLYKEPKRDDDE